MYSAKPSESRKEQKESQLKAPGLSLLHQSDVMDDGIKVVSGRSSLCPHMLCPSTTHQVPWPECRSLCEPFWSRSADRSCNKQLATQPGQSGCIAPTATLQATPRPLKGATEVCFAPRKGLNSRGSFSSQHLDAF